jgi:cell division protein FtsQ
MNAALLRPLGTVRAPAVVEVPLDVKLMEFTTGALLAALCVVGGSHALQWLLRQPTLAVRVVQVGGELTHVSEQALRQQVGPAVQGNWLTLPLAQVRSAFESVPWVRQATVQRQWPQTLKVTLQEHRPVAVWGPAADGKLLNEQGEVFEATANDLDEDQLPTLHGPQAQSPLVLAMYHRLVPVLQPLKAPIDALELSSRGSWRVRLESGARIELGSGSDADIETRAARLVRTLPTVASHHGRGVSALEAADLRYASGYALRLRGVATVAAQPAVGSTAQTPVSASVPASSAGPRSNLSR